MKNKNSKCKGHPAGEFDPMGKTVFCDGSCVSGFEAWMAKVDATVEHVMGCSVYDLPDYAFRDAYEDGCSYGNVASKAMKAAAE